MELLSSNTMGDQPFRAQAALAELPAQEWPGAGAEAMMFISAGPYYSKTLIGDNLNKHQIVTIKPLS